VKRLAYAISYGKKQRGTKGRHTFHGYFRTLKTAKKGLKKLKKKNGYHNPRIVRM